MERMFKGQFKNYTFYACIVVTACLVTVLCSYIFHRSAERTCLKLYEYVNKDVACGEALVIEKTSYNFFRESLITYIENEKKAGKLTEVSVFFRDLRSGPIFAIDDLETFSPASLLKLPLALTYLNLEHKHPGLFEKTISYKEGAQSVEQVFKPSITIEENKLYRIEDLVANMILYSDNRSYRALYAYLKNIPQGVETLFQTYQDLGVIDPQDQARENLNVHSYAGIFRILYNVSYLDAESSERILLWLVNSDFNEGLAKKLPSEVKVANKFGERAFLGGLKQLHDCGIIYYPGNPYVLCVMMKGFEWEELSDTIATISEKVYKEVDSRRINKQVWIRK